ncbi:MAG: hypothetical protein PWP23_2666 [Candidatus Sumerlaeota bacterium]|nr:hypothetical protein [Candidatus Sumerlaeota bacterium]
MRYRNRAELARERRGKSIVGGRRRVLYILSSHWDREWYEPFQVFRHRLVRLLDGVLAGLEDGRLAGPFTTDGQTIVLDDYLEVRPERRPAVERLAREGRLVVGPWYVLPDEFLVSGESLIRNLELGHAAARALGAEPSRAGFVCDLFGHLSQLPRLLAGFGIDNAFVWRGHHLPRERHLLWQGADGTELVCYHFPPRGYCGYARAVRVGPTPHGTPTHEEQRAALEDYLDAEADASVLEPLLIFDGGDHQEWDAGHYAVIAGAMRERGGKWQLSHGSLDEYAALMRDARHLITTRHAGEMRETLHEPGTAQLIPGVLSSRVPLKQANAECETLLCHWAEPLALRATQQLGTEYPDGFLRLAWKTLIENHPHDSICGCSIDQVHEDMLYRFSQCRRIASRIAEESASLIAARIEGAVPANGARIVLFNPLPHQFRGTTEIDLDVPPDYPVFREAGCDEPLPAFILNGPSGETIPYQRLGQAMNRIRHRLRPTKSGEIHHVHRVRVSIPVELPPLGWSTLTMQPAPPNVPTRCSVPGTLLDGPATLDNGILSVRAMRDGTLQVFDQRSGEEYSGLMTVEDRADIGDGWFHGVAVNDAPETPAAANVAIACIESGPFVSALRIRRKCPVARAFDFERMQRCEERAVLTIDTVVRLRPGSDIVECETRIDNTALDHRLRLLFPTGAKRSSFLTDSAFDVVERPVALPADNHKRAELAVETHPMRSWCALSDDQRGLAILATGLHECAVPDLPERPLALTLFRSTRRTYLTDGEPGGQLTGALVFRYALKFFRGAPNRAALCREAQRLAAGVRTAQLRAADQRIHGGPGALPGQGFGFELTGPAVLTSLRRVRGGVEARFFNPQSGSGNVRLGWKHTGMKFAAAHLVEFDGRLVGKPLAIERSSATVRLGPKQIATLRLTQR